MFTTDETIKGVHGIPQIQIEHIKAYLQGAVYCWCNSSQKYDVFYARDFLGGENFLYVVCEEYDQISDLFLLYV